MSFLVLTACEAPIEQPLVDEPAQETSDEVTGIARIGLFGGTEMGCEALVVGVEVKCNSGSGTIYLEMGEDWVYLQDYSCAADQYYTRDEEGQHVEYRPSGECEEGLEIGETYTATGKLTIEKDVWRNGKQVDEQWLEVESIAKAN